MKSLLRSFFSAAGHPQGAEESRLGRVLNRHRDEKPKLVVSSIPQSAADTHTAIRPLYDASVYVSPMLIDEEVPDVDILSGL